jgi:hypothetical protein
MTWDSCVFPGQDAGAPFPVTRLTVMLGGATATRPEDVAALADRDAMVAAAIRAAREDVGISYSLEPIAVNYSLAKDAIPQVRCHAAT